MSDIILNEGVKVEKHDTQRLYPFNSMEVGDYFNVDLDKHGSVRQLAYRHGKGCGKVFSTAKGDKGIITVTRVK